MKAAKACCLRSCGLVFAVMIRYLRDGSVGVAALCLTGHQKRKVQSAVKINQKSIMEKWGALCAFDALKSAKRKARVRRTVDNIGP
eukprot:scaffold2646_cov42-Cyclotella_meneghiniana.AAC.1